MNFFAQADAWVAANQTMVMAVFVAAFVAFHLYLLINAFANDEDTAETAVSNPNNDQNGLLAYDPMMF